MMNYCKISSGIRKSNFTYKVIRDKIKISVITETYFWHVNPFNKCIPVFNLGLDVLKFPFPPKLSYTCAKSTGLVLSEHFFKKDFKLHTKMALYLEFLTSNV